MANENNKKNETLKKIVIDIDINLWRELQYHKISENCSLKEIVIQALKEYTDKYIMNVPALKPTTAPIMD